MPSRADCSNVDKPGGTPEHNGLSKVGKVRYIEDKNIINFIQDGRSTLKYFESEDSPDEHQTKSLKSVGVKGQKSLEKFEVKSLADKEVYLRIQFRV